MDDLVNTWNENRKNNNCYAFAFDHLQPGAKEKLQPGELSGLSPLEDDEYTCDALTARVLKDNPGVVVSNSQHCGLGRRAVALFVDQVGENRDYHFYRQIRSCQNDENGNCIPGQMRWAHKPGSRKVSLVDDSGRAITDPRTADRDYVNDGDEMSAYNYAKFCTFYCVPGTPDSFEPNTNNLVKPKVGPQWLLILSLIILVVGIILGIYWISY